LNFYIAIAVLVGGLWLVKSYAKANPQQSKAMSNRIGGYVLLGFAAFVAFRGQIEYAVPVAVVALGMLGYQKYFGQKPQAEQARPTQPPPPRGRVKMSRAEALQVLGLPASATVDDIKAAHRRLLKDFHPDKGGSDYLAAKVNEAKDALLS
jgi:hypothetical protein